jgi:signal transduction histidine kinase
LTQSALSAIVDAIGYRHLKSLRTDQLVHGSRAAWVVLLAIVALPARTMALDLAEDAAGGVWAGTEGGLAHLVGDRFESFSVADGTSRGVVVRRGGRFLATAIREPPLALVADRSGRLWADENVRDGGSQVFSGGQPARLVGPAGAERSTMAMVVDPAGSVCIVIEPRHWRVRNLLVLLLGTIAAAGCAVNRARTARLALLHRAAMEERGRIARDLHDGLAQKLTTIGLLTDRARGADPDRQAATLGQVRQIVGEAHAELRRAILNIREPAGGQYRLEKLVEGVVSEVTVSFETTVTLETFDDSLPVSALVAHETRLILKEALVNAARHARARNIAVSVLSDVEGLQLWVRDDGCGISWAGAPTVAGGCGLIGMHERARCLGGTLTVHGRRGGGTEVSLFVPKGNSRATHSSGRSS